MMSETAGTGYRFLSGAEMLPDAVLAAYPGARFVARARLEAGAGETWGIVIRLATPAAGDETREITTDDGRILSAAISNGGTPTGDPAAILAAAKYWELPTDYVQTLATG